MSTFALLWSTRLEHDTKQKVQTPCLQPSNFIDPIHGADQATIPQHVDGPRQEEAEEHEVQDATENVKKFIHDFSLN